jgi:hypothetical protein
METLILVRDFVGVMCVAILATPIIGVLALWHFLAVFLPSQIKELWNVRKEG